MLTIDINSILDTDYRNDFSLDFEKRKYVELGGKLPSFFNDINEMSRSEVVRVVADGQFDNKTKFLAILFWGYYFKVMSSRGKAIRQLVKFIESGEFDVWYENRVSAIVEPNASPSALFKLFESDVNYKIPGVGYSYYTKLFFFHREANQLTTFPILDNWLGKAWSALSCGLSNSNEATVYDKYFRTKSNTFNGRLARKSAEGYEEYVDFMQSLSKQHNLTITELEEKLFGVDKRVDKTDSNPRIQYERWFSSLND